MQQMFCLGNAVMENLAVSPLLTNTVSPTCFVVEPGGLQIADGSTLLFQPGQTVQTVQFVDGSTAYLSAPQEVSTANFQQIELGNGTTAFIALPQPSNVRGDLQQRLTVVDTPICNLLKTEETEEENIHENAENDQLEYTLGLAEDEETEQPQFSILELEPEESDGPEGSIEEVVTSEGSHSDGAVCAPSEPEIETCNYEETQLNETDDNDPLIEDMDEEDEDALIDFPRRKGQSEKTKSFACAVPGCSKKYTALHHLKVHARTHTGDRPFSCTQPLCDKKFGTNYALKAHIRTHTGEKPYHCPEESCRKGFKTSGDLQKHIRTHTGERPFKCNVPGCNRSFTTSNIRKVHVRTHTGERPYECTEPGCGRAFASATNFKNHMRIHSGEKPYICTVKMCGRRFTEYSSLYKHQTVHTQQKPYECRDCGRNYRQSSTLTMHRRTAHGIIQSVDGSEIVLSLPDDNGKIENLMLLELTKEGNTYIPLSSNKVTNVTSSFARSRNADLDDDSNNDDDDDDDNEDDDVLMTPNEVIEDDDTSLRQIFVVSDDGDITYENFDALDSAVI